VMPALLLEQFRVFYGPDRPAAVALWAQVSEETEARLLQGEGTLRAEEWNGGDRFWLIELVAPFGAVSEILDDLKTSVFSGKSFKFHHTATEGNRVVITVDPERGTADGPPAAAVPQ
jgi:cytolysin-activating lysine-acyltransferase